MIKANNMRAVLASRWRLQQATRRIAPAIAKRSLVLARPAISTSKDFCYTTNLQSESIQDANNATRLWPTSTPSSRLLSTTKPTNNKKSPKGNSGGSTVPRTAISLLGAVNAGKSVLMNLLTQSDVSLVHATAGTTADPKICAMELHGRIGPVRLLDTPGIDERGELGSLKRVRAFDTIGQCDVALIVADPFEEGQAESVADILGQVQSRQNMNRLLEEHQVNGGSPTNKNKEYADSDTNSSASRPTPVPLLIFNLQEDKTKTLESTGGSVSMLLEDFEKKIIEILVATNDDDKVNEGSKGKSTTPSLPPTLAVDFASTTKASRDRVISFLERHADPRPNSVNVLPDWLTDTHTVDGDSPPPTVFLNIPMDQQTPSMRLLRPQAMIQEALIRNYVSTYAYRMDLGMARSDNAAERQREKDRFLRVLDPLLTMGNLSLLITDSQAIDIVAPWTVDGSSGNEELVPISTFSIAMIRYLSGGRLEYFAEGLRKLDQMVAGKVSPKNGEKWKILIAEACNHTRLNMEKECADIGTVQLPNHLSLVLGEDNVDFDYTFGKHVITDPTRYDLVVHCGGCMLNHQQMESRVADLMAGGVPATNYGLLLSRIQSPTTLGRVLKPWGVTYNPEEQEHTATHDNNLLDMNASKRVKAM